MLYIENEFWNTNNSPKRWEENLIALEDGQLCLLDEIDWGDGRKFKYKFYWNDNTSFALDIGDGEFTGKDGEEYFIHCEYNNDNGMWHYVFEVWSKNDHCNIYDIPESERNEYLTETEMEELRAIILNCANKKGWSACGGEVI